MVRRTGYKPAVRGYRVLLLRRWDVAPLLFGGCSRIFDFKISTLDTQVREKSHLGSGVGIWPMHVIVAWWLVAMSHEPRASVITS